MVTYRDQGIVLRTQKLGEADRIVTIFTKQNGVQRLAAKGVRKTGSKFGATLEPFMVIDFQGYRGRNLDSVTQAQINEGLGIEIIVEFETFLAANVLVETTEKLNDGQPFFELYNLLLGALRALAKNRYNPKVIQDAFLMRAISLSGWAPELENCVVCHKSENLTAISSVNGGIVCSECRDSSSFYVFPETINLLRAYLHGDWKESFAAGNDARRQASGFLGTYLQGILEKNLKSFSVSQRTLAAG